MHTLHLVLNRFDRNVSRHIHMLPSQLHGLMLAITFIGEPVTVITMAAIVGLVALYRHFYRLALAEIIGFGAFGVNTLIKHLVQRSRPDTMYVQHMRIHSYSFPSGHAFGSMFFYGLFAYLAYNHLPSPWNWLGASGLGLLILLIGISRVYLGAHFPSDVVVGWLFAGICLLLVLVFVKP